MAELSGLLLVVVILALLFDFSNGWHDSANAIATVVSTRVVSPSTAVLVAGVLNVAGAFMSTAVAKMVGTGIVDPQSVTQAVVASALAGAIVWNFVTLLLGLPTSSSHALIGGLVGAALTHGGTAAVKFSGLRAGADGDPELGIFPGAARPGLAAVLTHAAGLGQFHGIQPRGERCAEGHGHHHVGVGVRRSASNCGSAHLGDRFLRPGDGARHGGRRVADRANPRHANREAGTGPWLRG